MDWRYEIKYILKPEEWSKLRQVLIEHPASFREAYADRVVNNIYLDTIDLVSCLDNLAGISERRKYRIRWYGEQKEVVKPVFEQKIKNNALGRKESLPIEDWDDNYLETHHFKNYGSLSPILQNQYLRSYFVDWSGNFRLTVDRHIKYKRVNSLYSDDYSDAFNDEHIIVELKFNAEHFKIHKDITRYLPFRPSKHSKYVTGVFYCLG